MLDSLSKLNLPYVATFPSNAELDDLRSRQVTEKNVANYERSYKVEFWMQTGRIKVSTIHSFKGWELSRIYVLFAPSTAQVGTGLELLYTGVTRARAYLTVCAPWIGPLMPWLRGSRQLVSHRSVRLSPSGAVDEEIRRYPRTGVSGSGNFEVEPSKMCHRELGCDRVREESTSCSAWTTRQRRRGEKADPGRRPGCRLAAGSKRTTGQRLVLVAYGARSGPGDAPARLLGIESVPSSLSTRWRGTAFGGCRSFSRAAAILLQCEHQGPEKGGAMPVRPDSQTEFVRPRWSAYVRDLVDSGGITRTRLAALTEVPTSRVKEWLEAERAVEAQTAFQIGETLRNASLATDGFCCAVRVRLPR